MLPHAPPTEAHSKMLFIYSFHASWAPSEPLNYFRTTLIEELVRNPYKANVTMYKPRARIVSLKCNNQVSTSGKQRQIPPRRVVGV